MGVLAEETTADEGVEDGAGGPEVDGFGVAFSGVGVEEFSTEAESVTDA